MMNTEPRSPQSMGAWLAIGAGIGAALSVSGLGPAGIPIGIAIGMGIGALVTRRRS